MLVIKGSDKERLKRHTRGFEIYLLGLAYKAYMLGLFYMESSKRSSTIFTKPKESKDGRTIEDAWSKIKFEMPLKMEVSSKYVQYLDYCY